MVPKLCIWVLRALERCLKEFSQTCAPTNFRSNWWGVERRVSSMRSPVREDPHRSEQKFCPLFLALYFTWFASKCLMCLLCAGSFYFIWENARCHNKVDEPYWNIFIQYSSEWDIKVVHTVHFTVNTFDKERCYSRTEGWWSYRVGLFWEEGICFGNLGNFGFVMYWVVWNTKKN